MAKGFGIAALILAILAIFIPLVGIFVSGAALALALVSAFAGDRIFVTATSLIALINTFFFSPSVMLVLKSSPIAPAVAIFLLVCGTAPVGVAIGKYMLNDQNARTSPDTASGALAPSSHWRVEAENRPQTQRTESSPVNHASPAEQPQQRPTQTPTPPASKAASSPTTNESQNAKQAPQPAPPRAASSRGGFSVTPSDRTVPDYHNYASAGFDLSTARRIERILLLSCLCTYIVDNVVGAIAARVPVVSDEGLFSRQYVTNLTLGGIVVGLFSIWFFYPLTHRHAMKWGVAFVALGVIVSFLATLISSETATLTHSGSFEDVYGSLQEFWDYLSAPATLLTACYWIVPATLIGSAKEYFMLRPLD